MMCVAFNLVQRMMCLFVLSHVANTNLGQTQGNMQSRNFSILLIAQPWSRADLCVTQKGHNSWHQRHWGLHERGCKWVESVVRRHNVENARWLDSTHGLIFGAVKASNWQGGSHRGVICVICKGVVFFT